MADNVILNEGTGGATMRTYADAGSIEHAAAVLEYLTTVADGANVAQPVTPDHGLPVQQQGVWTVQPGDTANTTPWLMSINAGGNTAAVDASGRLTVNAVQSGSYTVAIAAGQSVDVGTITNPVAVTQSGDWTIDVGPIDSIATVGTITNPVAVTQSGSWSVTASGTVAATQSGAWDVGTVTTVAAVTSITNAVTVVQDTAANLLCTASIAGGQTLAAVTSITNPVAVTQSGSWSIDVGPIDSITTLDTITNPVAVTKSGTWAIDSVGSLTSITNPVAVTQSGTWNVGAVTSVSTVASVTNITNPVTVAQATASNLKATVDISSGQSVGLSAGTNLIGKTASGSDVGVFYYNGTLVTLKRAFVEATASGDTTVVAAVAGKSIVVPRYSIRSNTASQVKFRSNSTDISPRFYLTQFSVNNGAPSEFPHYATASGEALKINLAATGLVSVEVLYFEV